MQATPTSGRILLFDGFTITAADTHENQEEFPQNPSQKEGLGFPIIRGVSLISMVTGLLVDLETGPYAGKQSGETALLWKMLDRLKPGDTFVASITRGHNTGPTNIVLRRDSFEKSEHSEFQVTVAT